MAKYDAGGWGTIVLGAGMMATSFASNMPAVKSMGLPAGSMAALGAAAVGVGTAYLLLSR